jgi:hypothetical protein
MTACFSTEHHANRLAASNCLELHKKINNISLVLDQGGATELGKILLPINRILYIFKATNEDTGLV